MSLFKIAARAAAPIIGAAVGDLVARLLAGKKAKRPAPTPGVYGEGQISPRTPSPPSP